MEPAYSLKSVPLDSTKIQGWESNNLCVQNRPIEDYFAVSGKLPFLKIIPFDFVLLTLYAEKPINNGISNVDIRLISPHKTIVYFASLGISEGAQIDLAPSHFYQKGATIHCFCSDESIDNSIIATVYLKRIVLFDL